MKNQYEVSYWTKGQDIMNEEPEVVYRDTLADAIDCCDNLIRRPDVIHSEVCDLTICDCVYEQSAY